jgi:hypothetical protein
LIQLSTFCAVSFAIERNLMIIAKRTYTDFGPCVVAARSLARSSQDASDPEIESVTWGPDEAKAVSLDLVERCVQVVGDFAGGTVAIEGSNDGETIATLTDALGSVGRALVHCTRPQERRRQSAMAAAAARRRG